MAKNPPSLSIATEKVCFIVVKAREFDVKDVVGRARHSNGQPTDHGCVPRPFIRLGILVAISARA
jgi:hypothetical protein